MPEELQDVNPTESSPVEEQDVKTEESSTAEDVNVEESSTSEEEPKQRQSDAVPYERFQEVVQQNQKLMELASNFANRQQQGESQKQVEQDPYSGMNAEEAHFYRNLDLRTQKLIQSEAQKLAQPLYQQIQTLAQKTTQLMERDFRTKHTDVAPNSDEERKIADLINKGVDVDSAAWAVMGPKRVELAKAKKTVTKQQKVQQKANANLETGGIPSQNPLPTTESLSYKEKVDRAMREAGI